MVDIRQWLDKGDKSSERMSRLLPILIRQARLKKPITYGEVATELGIHHRAVHHIAGYIGFTLNEVAKMSGWKRRPPPPLHALIVNAVSHLPGTGIDSFLAAAYRTAKTKQAKRAVLEVIHSEATSYPYWGELCELLNVPLEIPALADAVEKARKTKGRGGEGPDHRGLKLFIRDNPQIAGLAKGSKPGNEEYLTASGDRVDVVFLRRGLWLAVEVKSHHSDEGDMVRGVFQCIKYRVILEAEAILKGKNVEVKVLLILGGTATPAVFELALLFNIDIKDNVRAD